MGCGSCFNESEEGKKCCCCECGETKTIRNKIIHKKEVIPNLDRTINEIDESLLSGSFDQNFFITALNKNNYYRELHGVRPLILDDYLNKMAFILAKQNLEENTLKYNNLGYIHHEELGMNVLTFDEKLDGDKLMDKWYMEKKNYNFIEPNEYDEFFDFTQMIWKDSTNFGCGYYCKRVNENNENNNNENQSNNYCYVALYFPAGNKLGEFRNNVFRSRDINQNENQRILSTENLLTLAENP